MRQALLCALRIREDFEVRGHLQIREGLPESNISSTFLHISYVHTIYTIKLVDQHMYKDSNYG